MGVLPLCTKGAVITQHTVNNTPLLQSISTLQSTSTDAHFRFSAIGLHRATACQGGLYPGFFIRIGRAQGRVGVIAVGDDGDIFCLHPPQSAANSNTRPKSGFRIPVSVTGHFEVPCPNPVNITFIHPPDGTTEGGFRCIGNNATTNNLYIV